MIRSYSQNNKVNFFGQFYPERILFCVKGMSKTWLIKQSIAVITIITAIALKQWGISEAYYNIIGCLLLATALTMIIRPESGEHPAESGRIIVKSAGIWIALWFFGQSILADIFSCGTFLFFNTMGSIMLRQEKMAASKKEVLLTPLISGIISNVSTFTFLLILSQIHLA